LRVTIMNSFFVYILKSLKDNKLYIGQTNNLESRLSRHNSGKVIATRNRRPLVLIYNEEYKSRADAMKREKYLKSLKNPSYIENKIIN